MSEISKRGRKQFVTVFLYRGTPAVRIGNTGRYPLPASGMQQKPQDLAGLHLQEINGSHTYYPMAKKLLAKLRVVVNNNGISVEYRSDSECLSERNPNYHIVVRRSELRGAGAYNTIPLTPSKNERIESNGIGVEIGWRHYSPPQPDKGDEMPAHSICYEKFCIHNDHCDSYLRNSCRIHDKPGSCNSVLLVSGSDQSSAEQLYSLARGVLAKALDTVADEPGVAVFKDRKVTSFNRCVTVCMDHGPIMVSKYMQNVHSLLYILDCTKALSDNADGISAVLDYYRGSTAKPKLHLMLGPLSHFDHLLGKNDRIHRQENSRDAKDMKTLREAIWQRSCELEDMMHSHSQFQKLYNTCLTFEDALYYLVRDMSPMNGMNVYLWLKSILYPLGFEI